MGLFARSIVGLEVDSREIRAVEVKGNAKKQEISAWGKLELREGVVKDGRVVDINGLSSALDTLWRENGFKSKDVIFGINNQDVIIRFASFPKVSEDRIRNMIMFQAQDYIPVPIDELQLDYIIGGEKITDEGEFLQVILVGARKKTLHDFLQVFHNSKLNTKEIDSGLLSIGRAALCGVKESVYAVISINYDMANILIFNKGLLSVARSVSYSQFSSWSNRKTSEDNINNETEAAIIADILINELKSSIGYYKMQSSESIEGLYLVNQLNAKSIASRISEAADYEVMNLQPYAEMESHVTSRNLQTFKADNYILPVSLGLRGLEDK